MIIYFCLFLKRYFIRKKGLCSIIIYNILVYCILKAGTNIDQLHFKIKNITIEFFYLY